ncbi:hypothetical protein [Flavobacterium piscinae]|uniref:hypothetical protein n=1 Tax=Flavobacterium piscinae TaxID=2506424 RepID=UPI002AAAE57F|nr:hypothetical protein [Flavobacterium piscinae]
MKFFFKSNRIHTILSVVIFALLLSCNKEESNKQTNQNSDDDRYLPKEYVQVKHPEWVKNATIYQLNTRQFSAEGTFKVAQKNFQG